VAKARYGLFIFHQVSTDPVFDSIRAGGATREACSAAVRSSAAPKD
jgi:hypothetical protein